jgi:DNA-binding FadR family transcriptional regulator
MSLRRETLPAGIAATLRRRIESGELSPGERLPGHRELARQFTVSLSSVREAISMLVSAGLVETRPGRGTFVSAEPPFNHRVGPPLTRHEVEELVEARALIEVRLAQLAAERADAAQIAALLDAVDHMDAASTSALSYPDADVEFHLALAAAANNRYLLQVMNDLRAYLRDDMVLGADAAIRRFGDLRPSVESHRQLAQAVAERDPAAAGAAAATIVNRNREFVLGLYALAAWDDE